MKCKMKCYKQQLHKEITIVQHLKLQNETMIQKLQHLST
jgi:hypothetical protein